MVITKKKSLFYLFIFLLPALLLYGIFFINPLIRGIQYSFTDWNGVVPEVPLKFERSKFEEDILKKITNPKKRQYLLQFYDMDVSSNTYQLKTWIETADQEPRQLKQSEKNKLKAILASAGVKTINFVGLANYIEMFKGDLRFKPRIAREYLFSEWDELPQSIKAGVFKKKLLNHIPEKSERDFLLQYYQLNEEQTAYDLQNIETESEEAWDFLDDDQTDEEEQPSGEDEESGEWDFLDEDESEVEADSQSDIDRLRSILAKKMYKSVFHAGVIGFTLFFTVFNVILTNLFALCLAMLLDMKMRTRNLLRSIFFLPNVLSLIIVAFLWQFVFRMIFPRLTGIDVWLGSPALAPWAVIIVSVWQGCGYMMVIYLAGLQSIPTDILEVARVDGATGYHRLFKIILPLLLPAMTICLFLTLSNSLKCFDLILALTSGGPAYVTTPIVLDIYFNAFNQNLFGYATAKAVFLCLVIILITSIQLYIMKKREVEL